MLKRPPRATRPVAALLGFGTLALATLLAVLLVGLGDVRAEPARNGGPLAQTAGNAPRGVAACRRYKLARRDLRRARLRFEARAARTRPLARRAKLRRAYKARTARRVARLRRLRRTCARARRGTGLVVTGTTSTSVTLNWNDHSQHANLLRYNVRQYTPAGVSQRTIFATKTSAHTVTGLTSGTSYKFAVAGVFPDGHVTQYSAQVQATAGGTPPPPPPPPSADPQPEGITWNGRRLSSWVVQHCPPFTTVTEMSESIGSFFRLQVNASGESCWGSPGGGTGSGHRAQVIPSQNTPVSPVPRFQTRYYDFGVRFPSGFGNMDNSHCDVFGFVGASMLVCTGNHADMEGQWLTIDRPHECGWRAPLQKGQGWHHFVWKVYHDVGAAGRLTVWHKPPGASAHSRVITNCAVETWTNTFGNATSGSHLTHQNYHGANDPIASQPWSDHRGVIQSTGHQID